MSNIKVPPPGVELESCGSPAKARKKRWRHEMEQEQDGKTEEKEKEEEEEMHPSKKAKEECVQTRPLCPIEFAFTLNFHTQTATDIMVFHENHKFMCNRFLLTYYSLVWRAALKTDPQAKELLIPVHEAAKNRKYGGVGGVTLFLLLIQTSSWALIKFEPHYQRLPLLGHALFLMFEFDCDPSNLLELILEMIPTRKSEQHKRGGQAIVKTQKEVAKSAEFMLHVQYSKSPTQENYNKLRQEIDSNVRKTHQLEKQYEDEEKEEEATHVYFINTHTLEDLKEFVFWLSLIPLDFARDDLVAIKRNIYFYIIKNFLSDNLEGLETSYLLQCLIELVADNQIEEAKKWIATLPNRGKVKPGRPFQCSCIECRAFKAKRAQPPTV